MSHHLLPPERVLLFSFSAEMENQVTQILSAHQMPYKLVSHDEQDETIGFLAGFPNYPSQNTPSHTPPLPSAPVLIMAGFSTTRSNELLSSLRQAGISSPILKAVVTPTNQRWSLSKLVQELQREQNAIASYKRKKSKRLR